MWYGVVVLVVSTTKVYRCPECQDEYPYAHAYRAADGVYWCPCGHHYITAEDLLSAHAEAVQ